MLPSRSVPQHEDDPDDWHRFLQKVSTGSIKAIDMLTYANMAYMVAVTGDLTSPDTLHLDDYNAMIRERFPAKSPIASLQDFHDLALSHGWLSEGFCVSQKPRNPPSAYVALWGRSAVDEDALMNDAMLHCLESWSADHFIECAWERSANYDSRAVATAMLYLSVTWPSTDRES